jgi:hypothetical protein
MKKLAVIIVAFLALNVQAETPCDNGRWSKEKAQEWYAAQPWIVGFNYVAGYAVNQIDMWQSSTFNPDFINREFAYSDTLGFNTVRIFLSDFAYRHEPDAFKKNLETFLGIADKHHLRVIVTFFTNGGVKDQPAPRMGKQPEPVAGIHGGTWQQSPGTAIVNDPTQWAPLEIYVKDIIETHKNDKRVLLWCLYNEPQNTNRGANSNGLLRAAFKWAREVNPSQPLSSPIWGVPNKDSDYGIIGFLTENCDIITFHDYKVINDTKNIVMMLEKLGRPMICEEYMGRPKSTFTEAMPLFKSHNIGAVSWGLVRGKMNYHYHWTHKPSDPEPTVWFHDIFNSDGTPYSVEEVELIKKMTGKSAHE